MKKKKYWELTTKELRAITKEFDEEFVFEKARPLTASEKEHWQRVRRKGSKPLKDGSRRISLRLEAGLLQRANVLARKRKLSRSQLFTQLLRAVLAASG